MKYVFTGLLFSFFVYTVYVFGHSFVNSYAFFQHKDFLESYVVGMFIIISISLIINETFELLYFSHSIVNYIIKFFKK